MLVLCHMLLNIPHTLIQQLQPKYNINQLLLLSRPPHVVTNSGYQHKNQLAVMRSARPFSLERKVIFRRELLQQAVEIIQRYPKWGWQLTVLVEVLLVHFLVLLVSVPWRLYGQPGVQLHLWVAYEGAIPLGLAVFLVDAPCVHVALVVDGSEEWYASKPLLSLTLLPPPLYSTYLHLRRVNIHP